MTYLKLLKRPIKLKQLIAAVYLDREAFEHTITRQLKHDGAAVKTTAVLHVRLGSCDNAANHMGALAIWKLLRRTGNTLLKNPNTITAVYLGNGDFAALMVNVQRLEAELHTRFLVYSIADARARQGDDASAGDISAGLVFADGRKDARSLLKTAEEASLAVLQKARGQSSDASGTDRQVSSIADEGFIPLCRISPDISLDSAARMAVTIH